MKAPQTRSGTPGAGNTLVLPFGSCIFQTDLQCWVMEMCRAFLASLGTAEDGGQEQSAPTST